MNPGKGPRRDAELLLVVLFWAFNISVLKICFVSMTPLAFNAVRFAGAAIILLLLTRVMEGTVHIARSDMGRVLVLSLVGHTAYQVVFVLGLDLTTASSAALIFGATPIVVGILTWLTAHERIGAAGSMGAALAFAGVGLVTAGGEGPAQTVSLSNRLTGSLFVFSAVVCWSIYTVMSRDLLRRYSPLRVTAVTLSIGAVPLIALSIPDLKKQDWSAIPALTWAGLAYSMLFALVAAYILWYRSVRDVGNLRTAIYSNLVPVFGALSGVLILGEKVTTGLLGGGVCIFAGILLTRLGRSGGASAARAERAGP